MCTLSVNVPRSKLAIWSSLGRVKSPPSKVNILCLSLLFKGNTRFLLLAVRLLWLVVWLAKNKLVVVNS